MCANLSHPKKVSKPRDQKVLTTGATSSIHRTHRFDSPSLSWGTHHREILKPYVHGFGYNWDNNPSTLWAWESSDELWGNQSIHRDIHTWTNRQGRHTYRQSIYVHQYTKMHTCLPWVYLYIIKLHLKYKHTYISIYIDYIYTYTCIGCIYIYICIYNIYLSIYICMYTYRIEREWCPP